MYDRTGLSTKCTLMKTGFKIVRTVRTVPPYRYEGQIPTFFDALLMEITHLLYKTVK